MTKVQRRNHYFIPAWIAVFALTPALAGPTYAQSSPAVNAGSGAPTSAPSTSAAPSSTTSPSAATSSSTTTSASGESTSPSTAGSPSEPAAPASTPPPAQPSSEPSVQGSTLLPTPETAGIAAGAPEHYDLDSTVDQALKASVDLANALRTVDIDRKKADELEARERPDIDGTASATRFDQATVVSLGSQSFTVLGAHTETMQLGISDQIDLTGQIHAAKTQEELQADADLLSANQIRNQRILLAKTTYYNLLRAQHEVAVANASLQTAITQQSTAVNLNDQQVGQKIDVLTANTQVAAARQQLSQAQADLGIARQSFDNLVGRTIDTPIDVDDVPGVTVGETITSATQVGAPSPNIASYAVPSADLQSIDLNQSIDTAYANRPDVLAAEVMVREAETGIKLAHAGLEPTLGLQANADYYPTTSFESPRQRTAAITAILTVPFYDGGATRDRVDEAKLETDNAQATLDSRRSDASLAVGQAYLNLLTTASQIDAANTALQSAVAARQLAQIRYEGQVGIYLEVTDAQAALVSAENNQVNAVYNYLVACAQFEDALGTPVTTTSGNAGSVPVGR